MDTRRSSSPRASSSDETRDSTDDLVEVVDLHVVTRGSRRAGGTSVVFVVLIALALAVAVTGLRGRPEAGELAAQVSPSATSPFASTVSSAPPSSPEPATTVSPAPTRGPRPTNVQLGFRPVRIDAVDGPASIRHLWEIDTKFVAVVDRTASETEGESVILTSLAGETWRVATLPVDDLIIRAGMVEGTSLTIVGRVPTDAGWAWGMWSTSDVATWHPWQEGEGTNAFQGFEDVADVRHLARNNVGVWVATVSVHRPDGDVDFTGDEVRFSEDGIHWDRASLPGLGDNASIAGVVASPVRFVVVTNEPTESRQTRITAWTSEDGRDWNGHEIAQLTGEASGLAGPEPWYPELIGPFGLVGSEVDGRMVQPRAWSSENGISWTSAEVETGSAGSGFGMAAVTAALQPFLGGTFVAIAESGGAAWTSGLTASWSWVQILPPDAPDRLRVVAVLDTVVAVGADSPDGLTIWLGKITDMQRG